MDRTDRSLILPAIAGLVVTCLGLGFLLGSYPEQQHEQNPRASYEAYQASAPDGNFAAYPEENSEACYRAKTYNSASLCAEWRSAIAAEGSADSAHTANLIAKLSMTLTVVGLGFVFVTFKETRRTAQAAIDGVKHASRAADAAHAQTSLMLQAQRPWIAISAQPMGITIDGDVLTIRTKITFKNIGSTVARNVIFGGAIREPDEGVYEKERAIFEFPGNPKKPVTIIPGEVRNFRIDSIYSHRLVKERNTDKLFSIAAFGFCDYSIEGDPERRRSDSSFYLCIKDRDSILDVGIPVNPLPFVQEVEYSGGGIVAT